MEEEEDAWEDRKPDPIDPKKPPTLKLSGTRWRDHPDWGPDTSNAIGEPKITYGRNTNAEHIEWKVIDDGRIGRVEIRAGIMGRFEDQQRVLEEHGFRIKGVSRLAKAFYGVCAGPLSYDSRKKKFEYSYKYKEKHFNNPEEAFDAFEALIVENLAVEQYDVRSTYKGYKGRLEVRSSAKFSTESLGVDDELDD